ncbi:hypothetical protein Acr_16g0010280 [Actinidia rufa]|uniref:Pentatricopeptide repeat (PPR) superfamily protein n=1 Tax=Actinidia rufa TaxID=165716 RepID=A0A7J0G0Q3_9ERIC|nr:hypothetical protein Acr_16g0010280 [Actinidia rufa]
MRWRWISLHAASSRIIRTPSFESIDGLLAPIGCAAIDKSQNLSTIGRVDVALRMLNDIHDPNFLTFSIGICNLCKLNDFKNIQNVLQKMLRMGYYPNAGNFSMVVNVFANRIVFSKIGRYDDALDVFFSLPKRKLVPDSYTLCSIMSAVCMSRQAGYPSGAVEFYNDMIDRGFIPDRYSYAGLLSGLCGMGRIGEAVNVYRAIVRNHFCLDPHIHTMVTDALLSSGNYHRAIRLFRKAVVEKYPLDVVSYTVAIHGLF